MRELARARVRSGYRRIYMLLKREGWDVGKGLSLGTPEKNAAELPVALLTPRGLIMQILRGR